jgi:hypothetical protein
MWSELAWRASGRRNKTPEGLLKEKEICDGLQTVQIKTSTTGGTNREAVDLGE